MIKKQKYSEPDKIADAESILKLFDSEVPSIHDFFNRTIIKLGIKFITYKPFRYFSRDVFRRKKHRKSRKKSSRRVQAKKTRTYKIHKSRGYVNKVPKIYKVLS